MAAADHGQLATEFKASDCPDCHSLDRFMTAAASIASSSG